ncbi:MAG TPA: hypothetical protein VNX40_13680 [Mucilaginibacter sp.]|jgi:hypothetical protein|nr:hypothetical protein [Mucilaginibacter sp.]
MNFLKGRTVRIIVNEPYEWTHGNLFGTIIYDHSGEKIMVKLSKEIKGEKFTSDLLELRPRYEKETFKHLTQNYSVTVGGALIKENSSEFDYILIGSVTID